MEQLSADAARQITKESWVKLLQVILNDIAETAGEGNSSYKVQTTEKKHLPDIIASLQNLGYTLTEQVADAHYHTITFQVSW